jgi:hypothetical protein
LFESYLIRNFKDIAKEDDADEKKGKGKKKDKIVDKKVLFPLINYIYRP